MTINEINSRIIDIWGTTPESIRGPYLPTLIPVRTPKPTILFVGINPSISEEIAKDSLMLDGVISPAHINAIHEEAESAVGPNGNTGFFNIFGEVSLEHTWLHIDLFYKREKSQKELERQLESGSMDFWQKQLDLFPEIVFNLNPKVIAVTNALASRIINSVFNGLHIPHTEISNATFLLHGWDSLKITLPKINEGLVCPVFFSSMLSGQRALDIHSRRRLFWHINKALSGN